MKFEKLEVKSLLILGHKDWKNITSKVTQN